jgi:putative transcriptional regulator
MKAMDFSFKNNTKPIKGALLLSDPFEADVHFTRSVVLICNHDENGTFGFVLNNYVHLPAEELNDELTSYKGRVSIGGPVDKTNLYYIHRFGNTVEDSEHIVDDLYFGGNFNQLIEQIKMHPLDETRARFFIGYSGWGEGQLEEELERNSWIVVNNIETTQMMNTTNNQFWKDIMTRQGMKFKLFADFPMNPENN